MELKGKLSNAADGVFAGDIAPVGGHDEKAVLALMGLGYDRREAENAVKRATSPDMTTEQIVYAVLHG